jgi:hypothetical protein
LRTGCNRKFQRKALPIDSFVCEPESELKMMQICAALIFLGMIKRTHSP